MKFDSVGGVGFHKNTRFLISRREEKPKTPFQFWIWELLYLLTFEFDKLLQQRRQSQLWRQFNGAMPSQLLQLINQWRTGHGLAIRYSGKNMHLYWSLDHKINWIWNDRLSFPNSEFYSFCFCQLQEWMWIDLNWKHFFQQKPYKFTTKKKRNNQKSDKEKNSASTLMSAVWLRKGRITVQNMSFSIPIILIISISIVCKHEPHEYSCIHNFHLIHPNIN